LEKTFSLHYPFTISNWVTSFADFFFFAAAVGCLHQPAFISPFVLLSITAQQFICKIFANVPACMIVLTKRINNVNPLLIFLCCSFLLADLAVVIKATTVPSIPVTNHTMKCNKNFHACIFFAILHSLAGEQTLPMTGRQQYGQVLYQLS
jgi:hypothetical protein